MAKKPTPEIPSSEIPSSEIPGRGGSYVVERDGRLKLVEATEAAPAVQVAGQEPQPATPPSGEPAAQSEER